MKTLALLAVSMLLAPMAYGASAGISVHNRQFSVTDLDPNDGVQASYDPFQWVPDRLVVDRTDTVLRRATQDQNGYWHTDNTPGSSFFVLTEKAFVDQFRLSPRSSLTFTFDAVTFASGVAGELADAKIIISWQGQFSEGTGTDQFDELYAGAERLTGPTEQTNARQMSITFENDTGSFVNIGLHESTGVRGLTPAIPEPETYALMLLGAGLVGWQVRRRRD